MGLYKLFNYDLISWKSPVHIENHLQSSKIHEHVLKKNHVKGKCHLKRILRWETKQNNGITGFQVKLKREKTFFWLQGKSKKPFLRGLFSVLSRFSLPSWRQTILKVLKILLSTWPLSVDWHNPDTFSL